MVHVLFDIKTIKSYDISLIRRSSLYNKNIKMEKKTLNEISTFV